MRKGPRFSRARRVTGAGTALLVIAVIACGGGGDSSTEPEPPGPAHGAWVAAGPGTITFKGDGVTAEPSLSYTLSGNDVFSRQTWTLKTTAPRATTITLPFTYEGYHAFFRVKVFVEAFVTGAGGTHVDTVLAQGPVDCCAAPSGGFQLADSVLFTVATGDEYGFRFGGSNYDTNNVLQGKFSITRTP